MFIGEFNHTIDDKGRLSIPAKFRARLASGCVVTRGLDKCLWVYPKDEWEKIAEKLANLPITQRDARSFARLMLAGAMDVTIDRSGRVNIPEYLIDYANIEKKATVCGLYNRIEIWPEESWDKFKRGMEENSDEIAENLKEIGF